MELVKDLKATGTSTLMYANPGAGKTTALSMLPGKTLIIDVDKGTSVLSDKPENVDIVRLKPDLSNLKSIIDEVKELDYDNVCLDTVSELEKTMLTNYGRIGKNDGAPEIGHYNKVGFKLADYIRELRNLTDKGINVIVTAWEDNKEIVEPSGEKYSVLMPMVRKSSEICGLFDTVARLIVSDKKENAGERFFVLEASANVFAKDRISKRKFCKVNELIKGEK